MQTRPAVCGALGDYDRKRVLRLADLGGASRIVHDDGRSILALDREPLRWGGPGREGLGWIEGDLWQAAPDVSDWGTAARHGACGLAIDGRRRYIHSSVSGLSPIYWLQDGGAVYFASRIEPLVQSASSRLSIDWEAWASIIALRYPLGDRTPFAEIRRLGPFSTLRRRLGRWKPQLHRWPWAEIEPRLGVERGAEAVAEELRRSLAALEGDVICPLSGGRDSRMLVSTLHALGTTSQTAVTVSDDEGDTFEQDLAAGVTEALGIEHDLLGAAIADYPADWEERARRVEYQFVDHAWLVPLARRITGTSLPVVDGFALDTLVPVSDHFHTPEALDLGAPRRANEALFNGLRRYGQGQMALEERFRGPILERSKAQFLAAVERFEGHPSQPSLSIYATRTLRGVSTYPTGLLGLEAPIFAPGSHNGVAEAFLSVSLDAKGVIGLSTAIQRVIDPGLASLPSTRDTPRGAPRLPRRWRSDPAVAAHRRLLAAGPLAPHISPDLRGWLESGDRVELSPDLRLGMEAVSLLHSWWLRYRDHLREVDPSDLLG